MFKIKKNVYYAIIASLSVYGASAFSTTLNDTKEKSNASLYSIGQTGFMSSISGMHFDTYLNTQHIKSNQLKNTLSNNYNLASADFEIYTLSPTKSGVYPSTVVPISEDNFVGSSFAGILLFLSFMSIFGVVYFNSVRKTESIA